MKRKGFTLIELLAVIVVLAIISLIATPIVMNVIKKANEGAAERSADNYVKAVETLIATEKLDGETIEDGNYAIDAEGNLTFGEVEVSGTKPVGGTVVITNGQVDKNNTTIDYTDYTVSYNNGKAEATEKGAKKLMTLADCDFLEEDTHNEGRNPNTVGAKYSCNLGSETRNFYILEAGTSSKPATLILEGNFDMETPAWCASGSDNACEADNLEAKLDDIVEEAWTKLDRTQIGLPSAEKIMVADGQSEEAYLNNPTLTNEWLYSYPEYAEWSEGMNPPYGYWTSTPYAGDSSYAWIVDCIGLVRDDVVGGGDCGVRPVITLSI